MNEIIGVLLLCFIASCTGLGVVVLVVRDWENSKT